MEAKRVADEYIAANVSEEIPMDEQIAGIASEIKNV
jgi:hypothetical protein